MADTLIDTATISWDETTPNQLKANLVDSSVVAAKLDDLAVTTAKLNDDAVTNAKLANMAQATFKMRAAAVGTGDPIDGTATQAKTALAIDHGADLAGLGDDDHTQYALLAGRAGGQALIGGTGAGDTFTIQSTSHATKGIISIGNFGTGAFFDEVNSRFIVGGVDSTLVLNATTYGVKIGSHTETDLEIGGHRHTNTAGFGASIFMTRSRGTEAAETIVQNNDVVMFVTAAAFDGTDYAVVSQMISEIDGTPGNNDMPGRLRFLTTAGGASTATEAMRIASDQSVWIYSLLRPDANDGAALGTGLLSFSDLFLASGGTINFNNGNYTITHSAGDLAFSGIVTIPNTGLHLLDTNASHDLIIKPGSDLTADRTLTVTTGDADRTLDISAANVTVSAFAATVLDDITAIAALTTLGVPYFYVANYGFAVAASAATNSSALDAAVAAADAAGGGRVILPSGTFAINAIAQLNGINSVVIQGQGAFAEGTRLVPSPTTGSTFEFSNCQHSGLKDINIRPTVRKTAGEAVKFTGDSYSCFAENVRVDYHYNGFVISSATETRLCNIQTRSLLGYAGVYFTGTSGNPSYRAIIDDYLGNNPYPGAYGTVKAHANSTAYSLTDIIVSGSYIWQCTTAGTSGVGTAPTTPGGTTAQEAFSTEVADGTVGWTMVCYADSAHIIQENYAYSLVINKAACINLGRGFRQLDTAATGTSFPKWAFIWDLECDHNHSDGVQLSRGEGCYINGSWLGSSLTSRGATINSTHRGEVHIGGGTRIHGNWLDGVIIGSGPVNTNITGCFIGDNSVSGSAATHGIAVVANGSYFQIVNNRIGNLIGTAGNNQGYGVLVNVGTSDYYIISQNIVQGNVSGGVVDGGTGVNKSVTANIG